MDSVYARQVRPLHARTLGAAERNLYRAELPFALPSPAPPIPSPLCPPSPLQGVRPVSSGLNALFGSGGGADDDEADGADPLVYVKPKDPAKAPPPAAKVRRARREAGSAAGWMVFLCA
jgi:hypothetical protein